MITETKPIEMVAEPEPDRSEYTCTDCGRKVKDFSANKMIAFCDDKRKQFYCGCRGWD